MSEKLGLTESEERELGTSGPDWNILQSGPGYSEKEYLESQSSMGESGVRGNEGSWSENNYLESHSVGERGVRYGEGTYSEADHYNVGESDEDFAKRQERETGTADPAKQKLVRELQQSFFSVEEIDRYMDTLADEPRAVQQVIERRFRQSLGDSSSRNLKNEQLSTDLGIINSALAHGLDVGKMRIDSEPMLHAGREEKPVGKWLDQLSDEILSNNPDLKDEYLQKISEIREKIKDPEETPEEKEQREKEAAKEAELENYNRQREDQLKEASRMSIEATEKKQNLLLNIRSLGTKIKESEDALARANQELANFQKNRGLLQKLFGTDKKKLAGLQQAQLEAQQKHAELSKQQEGLITEYEK